MDSETRMRRVRRRHVVATVGVAVLAVGAGAGIAAATIPSNGVISACYLKSGGSLRVIDAAVAKCRNTETSLSWNVQGVAGADGQDGQAGADGQDGADGVSGYEIVTASKDFAGGGTILAAGASAECPAGKKVLGGGANWFDGEDGADTVISSSMQGFPTADGSGWRVEIGTTNLQAYTSATIKVYAICASMG